MQTILSFITTIDPTEFLLYILLSVVIILVLWILLLEYRISRLLKGKSARSLERIIADLVSHKQEAEKFQKQSKEYAGILDTRIRSCLKKGELARFNAFSGIGEGGSQSFAVALVTEDGDGMVLSSIYTRDRMRIYAKPVTHYESTIKLTEEESRVLKNAKK